MKKIVVKLDLHDDKAKRKALKTVSTLSGIDSIAMDMKEGKLMVIGTVDPIKIVSKLRKYWPTTDVILVGPAKEPEKTEKKEEPKKEEGKKEEEPKKDGKDGKDGKEEVKNEEPKKDEAKKEEPKKDQKEEEKKPDPILELIKAYKQYNPPVPRYYYHVPSMEENPNACTIV